MGLAEEKGFVLFLLEKFSELRVKDKIIFGIVMPIMFVYGVVMIIAHPDVWFMLIAVMYAQIAYDCLDWYKKLFEGEDIKSPWYRFKPWPVLLAAVWIITILPIRSMNKNHRFSN